MRHLIVAWFGIPDGGVWSNLVASGITGGLVYWRARVHFRRHRTSMHAHVTAEVDRAITRLTGQAPE